MNGSESFYSLFYAYFKLKKFNFLKTYNETATIKNGYMLIMRQI